MVVCIGPKEDYSGFPFSAESAMAKRHPRAIRGPDKHFGWPEMRYLGMQVCKLYICCSYSLPNTTYSQECIGIRIWFWRYKYTFVRVCIII